MVINVFVELGALTSLWSVVPVFGISLLAAFFSWLVVEKPALALKDLNPRWLRRRIPRDA